MEDQQLDEESGKPIEGSETPNKNAVLEKTAQTFRWWNKLSTINAEDPIIITIMKIGIRIIGILFLIAISPLVILGIIFAIIGAS